METEFWYEGLSTSWFHQQWRSFGMDETFSGYTMTGSSSWLGLQ
jgi:hypothetical protein